MSDGPMTPGFSAPVLGAQSSFRALLHAFSHPGRIVDLPDAPEAPAPLYPATAALALALCDADTPLWHDAGAQAAAWLRFHTGAPAVSAPQARFLLATSTPPELATLHLGTEEAPQDGATLLLQVTSLAEAPGWRLTGPGILDTTLLCVDGLPLGFVAARAALAALFPRGLDIVLCCGRRIAALPRTTRVAEELREDVAEVPREDIAEEPRQDFPEEPRQDFPEEPRQDFPEEPRQQTPREPG